jgi:hypothetical protein
MKTKHHDKNTARRRPGLHDWAPPAAVLLGMLLLAPVPALPAEPVRNLDTPPVALDGYQVRWNTTVSGFLPRETIETHTLRPEGRGVLNVVILKDSAEQQLPVTVTAEVSATVTDMVGRVRPVDLREISENNRTSYLGTFDVEDGQLLRFDLQVTVPGVETRTFDFQRRFSID